MLSVLMPAYNAEQFIREAIDSVLAQTVQDLKLLVIDDGSKDGTLAVARDRAAHDPRVHVLSQPNQGIAATLNRGLAMLDDEWVFLMHADDVMMPHRIERQREFVASQSSAAVVSALVLYIDSKGRTLGHGRSPFTVHGAAAAAARRGELVAVNHPSCVLRREAVLAVGGYRQEFWPAEDCELWSRLLAAGHDVVVQDEYLLRYRIHGASASISQGRSMQEKTIWLERRLAARRDGIPEPSWEEFLASRRADPWPVRLKRARQEVGRTYYQRALHCLAIRDVRRLVPAAALASVLQPGLVLSRVLPRLVPLPVRRRGSSSTT